MKLEKGKFYICTSPEQYNKFETFFCNLIHEGYEHCTVELWSGGDIDEINNKLMTPENSAHSKMIKCKGKINPQNGRCDECFQLAMTSGNDCDRMIPYIEESKPNTVQEKPDFKIEATNRYGCNYVFNTYVLALQKENEQLKAEVERLKKLNKPIP